MHASNRGAACRRQALRGVSFGQGGCAGLRHADDCTTPKPARTRWLARSVAPVSSSAMQPGVGLTGWPFTPCTWCAAPSSNLLRSCRAPRARRHAQHAAHRLAGDPGRCQRVHLSEVRRLQVRSDGSSIVVQLVEEEQRRILGVAADIELPAARLGLARGAGVVAIAAAKASMCGGWMRNSTISACMAGSRLQNDWRNRGSQVDSHGM